MAGPITIKLTEDLTYEELVQKVSAGWDEKKYGKPQMQEVNSKKYLGFPGMEWVIVLAYPGRKRIVVQSMPTSYQIAFSKEGQQQIKKVNRELLPVIAQGFRELLVDILK